MRSSVIIASIAVFALMFSASAAVIADDSTADTSSNGPRITDSGFAKDRDSFFYYLKFAAYGFDSGGEATKVTPESQKNIIKANSVYACIKGLDMTKSYYVMIEELSSDEVVAKKVIKVKNRLSTVVWMSISNGKVFSFGVLADDTAEGTFSNTVGSQTYRITLKESAGFSEDGILMRSNVTNIDNDSKIAGLSYVNNTAELNELLAEGVSYGYGGTTAAYAGPKLEDYDVNEYAVVFFLANDKTMSMKLDFKGKVFEVPSDKIKFPKSESYGYVVLSVDDITGVDDIRSFTATIYNGDTTYDVKSTDDSDQPSSGNNNTIIYIAIGGAAVLLIAVALILIRRL